MKRACRPRVRLAGWVVVTGCLTACGGGGAEGGGPADAPRETAVIIPAADIGWDTGSEKDAGVQETRWDTSDGLAPTDWTPGRDDLQTPDAPPGDDAGQETGSSSPDTGQDVACTPSCAGKVCGPDGCGGSCGSCQANEVCQGGACLCVPNCTGRECGSDGCGGTCKPGCSEGVPCLETGKCAKSGPCSKHETLSCTEEGSSSSNNNGWPPNSDVLDQYSCDPTLAHGPEKVYRFVPDQSGEVTWTLQGPILPDPPAFLNLYLLQDQGEGCTSRSCIAFDHRTIKAHVEAGRIYWVVVDAVQNNSASYDLTMTCSWVPTASDP